MAGKAAPKKNLSAIKRVRQAEKRQIRNKSVRTALKTLGKKLEAAVASKKQEEVEKALRAAITAISKAASKGVIHKNTASRKISRLTKIANTVIRPAAA